MIEDEVLVGPPQGGPTIRRRSRESAGCRRRRTDRAGVGARHLQVFLLFVGLVALEFVRTDISIAVVAMTDPAQDNSFDWSFKTRNVIMSAFKWCYIFLKIPGGELASRFGGKVVLLGGALTILVPTILTPTAAYYGGWMAVCACRVLIGLAHGMVIPSLHCLYGKWVPVDERARAVGVGFSALLLGAAIEYTAAGTIATKWGWSYIFYFNAGVIAIWTSVYYILGSSSPEDSKTISEEERQYIQKSLGQVAVKKRLKTPWKAIVTSVPYLAVFIAQIAHSWGDWFILYQMPTYINNILGVSVKVNGYLSSIPYSVGFVTCIVFGFTADWLLQRGVISVTGCRKLFNSIGSYGAGVCLTVVTYVTQDVTLAVALFVLAVGCKSALISGYRVTYLDLSPNHSGTLVGIAATFTNLISTFIPLIVSYVVLDEFVRTEWRKVFFLTAAIFFITNTLFIIFGKAELQPWNDQIAPDIEEDKDIRQKEKKYTSKV